MLTASLTKVFSQRDPRWAAQRLGTVDGTTIGGYGCYVTAMAIIAVYFGKDIDPARLDDFFTKNNLYSNGNLMYDDNLQKLYGDIVYQQSIDYSNAPADLGKLRDLLSDPKNAVILEVDFNPATELLDTHFVAAASCDGTNVMIADPWTGTIHNINTYGDAKKTIQKFVVYRGNPAVTPEATITIPVSERDNLISRATVAKEVAQYLGIDDPDHAPTDRYKKSIDGLKSATTAAQTQITDLKTQLAEAQAEVANRDEQVSRIKQQVLDTENYYKAQIDTLNKSAKNAPETVKAAEGRVAELQGQLNDASKAKGEAQKQVAVLKTQLDACQKGQTIVRKTLIDQIIAFLKGIRK